MRQDTAAGVLLVLTQWLSGTGSPGSLPTRLHSSQDPEVEIAWKTSETQDSKDGGICSSDSNSHELLTHSAMALIVNHGMFHSSLV